MARVDDSYQNVIGGVSQQVPQDRRPGQHQEQVNMISDPVRGLARRHGSEMLAEVRVREYSPQFLVGAVADTAAHKVFPFQSEGQDFDLIYRTQQMFSNGFLSDGVLCFNRTASRFVPVVFGANGNINTLLNGGVSALANVGRFVLLAGNSLRSSMSVTNPLDLTSNALAVWVRGGAYSRTYKVTAVLANNTVLTAEYKTPSSSYPNLLDTSDIPLFLDAPTNTVPNPNYQKQVNDRVNDYNSKVTQWIGTAAAAIVPRAIALSLRDAMVAAGWDATGMDIRVVDSTILMDSSSMPGRTTSISAEDGGDGVLVRAVGNEIASAEQVSTIHQIGKVVRVRPKRNDGTDVYYLKAYQKGPVLDAAKQYAEVTWREAAGVESTPSNLFCYATVQAGTLYVGGTPAELTAMSGVTTPAPLVNGVGDPTSSPYPQFIGKRIDFMSVFQDRLVIGAGAVLYFSRTGDYQNFWRQSVLTIDATDPVELFALGAEDDTIRTATTYDRNLLLFGKRKQYVVSGRQPLTPTNASIVVQSSHEGAVDSFPVNSGNYVFYNKYRNGVSSTHQVQIGQLADTPESYEVSQQLDRYLVSQPQEIMAVTAPNTVFVRTRSIRDAVYVYTYLDSAAGSDRLFDSWSRWQWHPDMGSLIGMSKQDGDIILYMVRRGRDSLGAEFIYWAAERFVLDTSPSLYPYLDSRRPESDLLTPGTSVSDGMIGEDGRAVVFGSGSVRFHLGLPQDRRLELDESYPGTGSQRITGWEFPAFVTPTNPYLRDSNGKAIVSGRLTLMNVSVSVADTGGLIGTVTTPNGTTKPTDFTGHVVGRKANQVGRQPLVTTSVSVNIGREVRECSYTLSARQWLPLTITAIEWHGQFFNNTPRR